MKPANSYPLWTVIYVNYRTYHCRYEEIGHCKGPLISEDLFIKLALKFRKRNERLHSGHSGSYYSGDSNMHHVFFPEKRLK